MNTLSGNRVEFKIEFSIAAELLFMKRDHVTEIIVHHAVDAARKALAAHDKHTKGIVQVTAEVGTESADMFRRSELRVTEVVSAEGRRG